MKIVTTNPTWNAIAYQKQQSLDTGVFRKPSTEIPEVVKSALYDHQNGTVTIRDLSYTKHIDVEV